MHLLDNAEKKAMRRGIGGYSQLDKAKKDKLVKEQQGKQMKEQQMKIIQEQLQLLKDQLTDFYAKYKKQIQSNPLFLRQFNQLCSLLSVDPLSDKDEIVQSIQLIEQLQQKQIVPMPSSSILNLIKPLGNAYLQVNGKLFNNNTFQSDILTRCDANGVLVEENEQLLSEYLRAGVLWKDIENQYMLFPDNLK